MQRRPGRRWAPILACWLWISAGCGACESERVVEGPTPYARCLAAEPPSSGRWSAGGLALRLEERKLTLEPPKLPLRIAAFAGPGSGAAPSRERWQALARSGAGLGLLVGDVGDAKAVRQALIAGLASLPFPTLALAGGRDAADAIDATPGESAGKPPLINITTVRQVRIGNHTFVPVAGAAAGRYARHDRACGFGLGDLKDIAEELGNARQGEMRWLLAWHAPGAGGALGVARTSQGVDVGSADLAELARRIGAPGGIFAWPHVQAGRPRAGGGRRALPLGEAAADFRLVVPRIGGAAQELSDGSRALPGFALLELSEAGLSLVSIRE